ncbi:MAG: peptidase C39 family protein [Chloroflexota bacterium]
MAVITPYDNKVAVWLVHGSDLGENSIDEVAQTLLTYAPAVNAVWVKTSDGSDWMSKYDSKPALWIDGPAAIDRWVSTLQKYGLEFHAWCVPRGLNIDAEANVIIQTCQRPGVRSMVFDVEPYPGFYAGGQASIRPLMLKIRAAIPGSFHIGMSVDARQAHYNEIFPQEWFPFVNSIHPQVYWPDFGVTPEVALGYAYQAWGSYGKPIIPALEGYNTPTAMIDRARTVAFSTYHAVGTSWWAFGHIDADHFTAMNHTVDGKVVASPPGSAGTPVQSGTPIVVTVGSPNYQDGAYEAGKPGFSTYPSTNGGTGKYRAVDQGVANVFASYDPKIKQAGWYKIEAYISNQHATTGNARYKIHGVKDRGSEWLVSAAQSGSSNSWMTLGTFQIDTTQPQPGVVFLNDWTFELGREIAFDAIRWTPVSAAVGAKNMLDVPYRSQEGADARRFRNDCGPACVAMLFDWQRKIKGLPAQMITVDQFAAETSLSRVDDGLATIELVQLAAKHSVSLRLSNSATLPNILSEVSAGRPVLMLISYAPLTGRQNQADRSGHFVIVNGYDANFVYINDPDWWNTGKITSEQGHNWQVPISQFSAAIKQAPAPYQGCFITI